MNIFITAIGTDSGKTIVSSIFAEALGADYWKPVQAGFPKDSDVVKALISNSSIRFHDEAYLLKHAESPHSAAKKENISINLGNIYIPKTENHLIVEGAGGLLVPLNDHDSVIDLAEKLNLDIVLVANIYLGSINHTLLSVNELERRKLNVIGIVFNGDNQESENIILKKSRYKRLLKLEREKEITPEVIKKYAQELRKNLNM